MPTYDYGCGKCGHTFEVFEGITAEGPRTCPRCGLGGARRLISTGSGFIFKGSGFYTTDYKRSSASSSASKEKAPSAKAEMSKC
jgi:putative FmdB family regulatory protein